MATPPQPPPGAPPRPGQPPSNPPQPADETVIAVPVPEGMPDLLDPAVIEKEVEHGEEQDRAEAE